MFFDYVLLEIIDWPMARVANLWKNLAYFHRQTYNNIEITSLIQNSLAILLYTYTVANLGFKPARIW